MSKPERIRLSYQEMGWFRKKRVAAELSQREVAELCNTNHSQISRAERGLTIPVELRDNLRELFGVVETPTTGQKPVVQWSPQKTEDVPRPVAEPVGPVQVSMIIGKTQASIDATSLEDAVEMLTAMWAIATKR